MRKTAKNNGTETEIPRFYFRKTALIASVVALQFVLSSTSLAQSNEGQTGSPPLVGLRLGRKELNFFEHDKKWTVQTGSDGESNMDYGSWYRFYSGPWDTDNHGTILSNPEVGEWIYKTIVTAAGPQTGPELVGTYVETALAASEEKK